MYLSDTLPVFVARPNWSETFTETLAWRTDYMSARDGSRQKRQMRLAPRRSFAFTCVNDRADRNALTGLRYALGAGECLLPIWPDVQILAVDLAAGATTFACATPGRDFVAGGKILIYAGPRDWETASIASFDTSVITLAAGTTHAWAAGALLYPLRRACFADNGPQETRLSDQVGQTALTFNINEPCDWTATLPAASYRAMPVLESAPEETGALTDQFTRVLDTVDVNTGPVTRLDLSGLPLLTQDHQWLVSGRSDYAALRSLLYWLAGRMGTLWVPSFGADLQLTANITATSTMISVLWCGYGALTAMAENRRDIRIELYDGTIYYRRITGVTAYVANETLTLDSALGAAVAITDVRRISFMMLAELAGDELQLEYLTDADGLTRVTAKWQGLAHDV